uniref:Exostosin GT47 domain-containing protein n=1 Tax=Haptolina brevifila TaxID=156173 RepID=A0A7S2DQN9_9EUKA
MAKVEIKFSRGGPGQLTSKVKENLRAAGWSSKDVRLPYSVDAYSQGMLHSDFCVLPRGDEANPGRRLVDAVAAGCIPLIIADNIKLPLRNVLQPSYENFTLRIAEADFVRYPTASVNEVLKSAIPRLPSLRRGLMHARESMLLGMGVTPLNGTTSAAHGADLVLLEAGRAFCPRSPSTFKSCIDVGFA